MCKALGGASTLKLSYPHDDFCTYRTDRASVGYTQWLPFGNKCEHYERAALVSALVPAEFLSANHGGFRYTVCTNQSVR